MVQIIIGGIAIAVIVGALYAHISRSEWWFENIARRNRRRARRDE